MCNKIQTLGALYRYIADLFEKAGLDTPALDARYMINNRLGYSWADLVAQPERKITSEEWLCISPDIQKRLEGCPVSRIYGEREFWGLAFEINEHTLDPRPDTEVLVQAALDCYKGCVPPVTILDLGTGSGCILTALLSEWADSRGVAVDRSFESLRTARRNASRHGVGGRSRFLCGDWGDALRGRFELIVSNPPYIRDSDIPNLSKGVRAYDPIPALSGGNDGLKAYKKILGDIKQLLSSDGKAFLEMGFDQEVDLTRLAGDSRIRVEKVYPDLSGKPRVVEMSCGDK